MASTTLTEMPSAIFAGDTLLLLLSGGDYPADQGWTMYFQFGADISFQSSASGSNHSFTVSKSTTSGWQAGEYLGIGYVDNGTNRHTVWQGTLEIKPGLSIESDASDLLPWFFAARDSMRLVVAGKAGKDVLNSTIAGQSVQRLTPDQAIELLEYLESKCDSWLEERTAQNGKTGGRLVKVRFGIS